MDRYHWYLCSHTGSALEKEKEAAGCQTLGELKAREEEVPTKATRT